MEGILLKYIPSEISEEKVNDIVNKFVILKKESDAFHSILEDNKIILNQKSVIPFYDFLYAFYDIYDLINVEEFSKELDSLPPEYENSFWKNIIRTFNYFKAINSQTTFLKEIDLNNFKDLITYTFDNHIMYNGIFIKYKKWDIKKIRITKNTINTFLECMIVDFNNFDMAVLDLDLRFQFGKEKYHFIWDLCEKNKMYLMMKHITEEFYIKKSD